MVVCGGQFLDGLDVSMAGAWRDRVRPLSTLLGSAHGGLRSRLCRSNGQLLHASFTETPRTFRLTLKWGLRRVIDAKADDRDCS